LNQDTIKDKTLLPLIGEVIDKLKNTRYFNELDLIWEYRFKKSNELKSGISNQKRIILETIV